MSLVDSPPPTAALQAVPPAIETRGLGKRFAETTVLKDIGFSVARGEIVALIGPSGCGKSTLLNILSGLMAPDEGSFLIDGVPHERVTDWRRVAYMFQEDRLLPWRSVRANIGFGLEAGAVPRAERAATVDAALRLVGLDGYGDSWPHQLSGGMRSRAALARSLVVEPSLLLMDEPFSKLDPHTRSQMHTELLRIQADRKVTVVLVTHDMEEAVTLADRIVLLAPRPGRIVDTVAVALPRPRVATDAAVTEQIRRLRLRI
jgi:ABC-type nitrate/sulfonate/bicarbonate transport system ATPase subunit